MVLLFFSKAKTVPLAVWVSEEMGLAGATSHAVSGFHVFPLSALTDNLLRVLPTYNFPKEGTSNICSANGTSADNVEESNVLPLFTLICTFLLINNKLS